MDLTYERARELSIKKWEYLAGGGDYDGLVDKIPVLTNLQAQCGFCELYRLGGCEKCPLGDDDYNCCKSWDEWCDARNGSKEELKWAKKVFEEIKNTPEHLEN